MMNKSDEQLATDIMRLCGAENEHARIAAIIAAVRAEEREAIAADVLAAQCAIDVGQAEDAGGYYDGWDAACETIAAAIRAQAAKDRAA